MKPKRRPKHTYDYAEYYYSFNSEDVRAELPKWWAWTFGLGLGMRMEREGGAIMTTHDLRAIRNEA